VKILLVEDHDAVRRILAIKLMDMGHLVEPVGTLTEASSPKTIPDLVICDYLIGDATARDVGRLYPTIPMVVISGHHQPLDFIGEWVMKPVLNDDLKRAIDRAVAPK